MGHNAFGDNMWIDTGSDMFLGDVLEVSAIWDLDDVRGIHDGTLQ